MALTMTRSIEQYLKKKPLTIPLDEGECVGRVTEVQRGYLSVITEKGEMLCKSSGSLLFTAKSARDLPTVGDYVTVKVGEGQGLIQTLLPRDTLLSRIAPGDTNEEQLLAANVDKVLVTTSLTAEFNLRRIERYLMIAWESGAIPIIVLTKADLCSETAEKMRQTAQVALGTKVFAVSTTDRTSILALKEGIGAPSTVVLVGSSGVGKSTLINHLLEHDLQAAQSVREGDSKGRHTTTARSMLASEDGLLIIDTPGMRELQIHGDSEAMEHTFDDVVQLEQQCRFTDCKHDTEPGCRIQESLANGQLTLERLQSYQKLERERLFVLRKSDKALAAQQRVEWKQRNKQMRQRKKLENW